MPEAQEAVDALLCAEPAIQERGRVLRARLPGHLRSEADRAVLSALGCAAGSVRLGMVAPAPELPSTDEVRGSAGTPAPLLTEYDPRYDVVPPGKRLVVLPTNAANDDRAAVVLDAIDRLSVMPGKTMVLWNDAREFPSKLEGRNRLIVKYGKELGWAGISAALAYAYRHALDRGYAWVIKLDTDTALLARGFDARLCSECPADAQMGTMVDVTRCGMLPDGLTLYNSELAEHFNWARELVASGRRRFDHIQGGIYVLGDRAIQRLDREVGLVCANQSHLPEKRHVGEDVLFDTMAKVAGVRQIDSRAVCSWWKCTALNGPAKPEVIDHVRYHRDVNGVVAWHPVKHLETLKLLADEATGADVSPKAETRVMEVARG